MRGEEPVKYGTRINENGSKETERSRAILKSIIAGKS